MAWIALQQAVVPCQEKIPELALSHKLIADPDLDALLSTEVLFTGNYTKLFHPGERLANVDMFDHIYGMSPAWRHATTKFVHSVIKLASFSARLLMRLQING